MSRIQELADQAKESVPKGILAPDLWIKEYNRIFAELIIQNCISIIHEQDRIPKEFLYPKSAVVYETVIREHFGLNGNT